MERFHDDIQKVLQEQMSRGDPIKEIILYVKEEMKKNNISEQTVVGIIWYSVICTWNEKMELAVEDVIKHIKQYIPLLSAFTTQSQSELTLLLKIHEYCDENINFVRTFRKIVNLLYKSEVFREKSILQWYDTQLSKGKSIFLEEMKKFVEWIREEMDAQTEGQKSSLEETQRYATKYNQEIYDGSESKLHLVATSEQEHDGDYSSLSALEKEASQIVAGFRNCIDLNEREIREKLAEIHHYESEILRKIDVLKELAMKSDNSKINMSTLTEDITLYTEKKNVLITAVKNLMKTLITSQTELQVKCQNPSSAIDEPKIDLHDKYEINVKSHSIKANNIPSQKNKMLVTKERQKQSLTTQRTKQNVPPKKSGNGGH